MGNERSLGQKELEFRPQRRVVVTGIGAITPLGKTVEESWQNSLLGKSCASVVADERFRTRVAHKIDFNLQEYFSGDELRELQQRTHRNVQFGLIAACEALSDAGLLNNNGNLIDDVDRDRGGVRIGTGVGGVEEYARAFKILSEQGPRRVDPLGILRILSERTTAVTIKKFGLRACPGSNVMACAGGAGNTADAFVFIQANKADYFVCGGTEAGLSETMLAMFGNIRATSSNFNNAPNKASRPFDAARDGFVPSEGAIVLVIEEATHAIQRGARIYAELAGVCTSADGKDDVLPDPENVARTVKLAIDDAGVLPEEVDVIVAHATSTPQGDLSEIKAYRTVFGDLLPKIAITAPKSMFGHQAGAAGALNAMIAVKAIETGKIPPTINLENPNPEFRDLNLVPNSYQQKEVKVALANAFGFGGLNAVLVFRRFS